MALGGCYTGRSALAVANLRPYEPTESAIHTITAGTSSLELRQRRHMLEYWLRLDNALNDLVTEAELYEGDPRRGGVLVGTLFREARVRGRWLHMRGTVEVAPSVTVADLEARLRANPNAFVVRVKSEGAPDGALIGFLR